jgi:D-alanyl-D-alanine carboxypeptidase (penicillin-binding protein 5/6)
MHPPPHMNATAQALGLNQTHFENPHGMSHRMHKSTAWDLAQLAVTALQNEQFCEIVASQTLSRRIYNTVERRYRQITWSNTNELLQEGYYGIKTGVTPATGYDDVTLCMMM